MPKDNLFGPDSAYASAASLVNEPVATEPNHDERCNSMPTQPPSNHPVEMRTRARSEETQHRRNAISQNENPVRINKDSETRKITLRLEQREVDIDVDGASTVKVEEKNPNLAENDSLLCFTFNFDKDKLMNLKKMIK